MKTKDLRLLLLAAALLWAGAIPAARGIILLGTGDPTANTAAPTGDLAESGWQYEGSWGGFLGTPIAPHFFLSADHIGQTVGTIFEFQGVSYKTIGAFRDPSSDLTIWQVAETFPTYAPLYAKSDEIGKRLVAIGRGTRRGAEIMLNGVQRGWSWAEWDAVQRWGENYVSGFADISFGNDAIRAAFDATGTANECTFSVGDSGGAVFLNDGGVWKLAGINYGVDGPLYTDSSGGGQFYAALYDARGFYEQSGANYVFIGGRPAVPVSLYATRISSKIPWIYSVIDPSGDPDGDGLSNLTEYALHLDPLTPDAASAPKVTRAGDALTLTYPKATRATDLTYTVEQSSDLLSWTAAQTQDQAVAQSAFVQTVSSTVAANGASRLFLRLRVSRP